MAENLEELLGEQLPLGEWGTVTFAIPDFLETFRDTINDFAELLIGFLEVANQALEFVKAFLTSYLDPAVALIETIIDEINALIQDFRQIGIYITGDWALLGWPPDDLRGGFAAYERRMIARLADRTDPTRPDLSSKVTTLGFFSYLSVDPSDIERLFNFILGLIKLFGLSFFADTSKFPIPNILDVVYGADTTNVQNFGSLIDTLTTLDRTPPQKARITWNALPAAAKSPLNPFPVIGPVGFIVTVSVFEEGLPLHYGRPKANTDKKDSGGDQVQPREYGVVRDTNGRPVVLHGGAEMLSYTNSVFNYNDGIDTSGKVKDGRAQVWGQLQPADNEIVPLELLGTDPTGLGRPGDGKGHEFAFQRTFLIESSVALAHWFAGEFSAVLDLADMPATGVIENDKGQFNFVPDSSGPDGKADENSKASTYYVRIWSAGKEVADGTRTPRWNFTADAAVQNQFTSGQPFIVGLASGESSIGFPSTPRKITFVNAHTAEYLAALQTALLILVLSRSDLPIVDEMETLKGTEAVQKLRDGKWAGQGFALLGTTLEASKGLIPRIFDVDAMSMSGLSTQEFRTTLYNRIKTLALDIYERTGPNLDAERVVVESTADLRATTWTDVYAFLSPEADGHYRALLAVRGLDDATLFEGLNPENPIASLLEFGLAPNIYSMGIDAGDVDELFYVDGAIQDRSPMFSEFTGGAITAVYTLDDPVAVTQLIETAPPSLRAIYEQHRQEDGTLLVPEAYRQATQAALAARRVVGSGDLTPVFYAGQTGLVQLDQGSSRPVDAWEQTSFCRSFFANFEGADFGPGGLYNQSALVLNIATASFDRSPEDGEWIAVRLFDSFPQLEEFLTSIENWVRGLNAAIKSIADTIIKYIEFVQAQIVELQQLIRRINSMIQSLLSFSFALPSFSGLMLVSNGTDGVMADFVTSTAKPSDSPQAYGAGIALVVPLAPTFLLDLIFVGANAASDDTHTLRPPPAVGIENLPDEAARVPSDEPDVL